MASALFLLALSLAFIAVGLHDARLARRMRGFATTRARVVGREVVPVPSGDTTEGRWGEGGGSMARVVYEYEVDGVTHRGDRDGHAIAGLKREVAERRLAAVPDEVVVVYDPAAPDQAWRRTHGPWRGRSMAAGGALGVLVALVLLLGG